VAFIEVSDLVREFRSYRGFSGPLGPIRSLFSRQYDVQHALDGVSFTIRPLPSSISVRRRSCCTGKGRSCRPPQAGPRPWSCWAPSSPLTASSAGASAATMVQVDNVRKRSCP
jgi:hypothetical protein